MSEEHSISAEAAGAGFAAVVVFMKKFRGQEISAEQALMEFGIEIRDALPMGKGKTLTGDELEGALALLRSICMTITERAKGWRKRSLFKRQWMFRDFKKNAGMSVERWLDSLDTFERALSSDQGDGRVHNPPLDKLSAFYVHLKELAAGYEKDAKKLEEHNRIIDAWKNEVDSLISLLER